MLSKFSITAIAQWLIQFISNLFELELHILSSWELIMEWVNEKLKLLKKKVIINAENIFLFNTLLKISLIINRIYLRLYNSLCKIVILDVREIDIHKIESESKEI